MLVLVNKLDRIVDFGDKEACEINVELKLLNCDNLVKQAKEIDKEDFCNECFGISFNYIYDDDKLYILNVPNCIYYIDTNGEKNYLEVADYVINNIERIVMTEFKKFLQDKDKYMLENGTDYDIV